MTTVELLAEFDRRGIALEVRNGIIVARPKGATPPELREAVRKMKEGLIQTLAAKQAGTLLDRWKGYVVPGGRMADVREMATKLIDLPDLAALLLGLRDFERELISLGGEYDPDLAEAVTMVKGAFPGARLTALNRKLQ